MVFHSLSLLFTALKAAKEVKLTLILSTVQPYDVNLQVTSVIALLSQFQHPQLQEYLLNATLPLAPDCHTLHLTLQNVSNDACFDACPLVIYLPLCLTYFIVKLASVRIFVFSLYTCCLLL